MKFTKRKILISVPVLWLFSLLLIAPVKAALIELPAQIGGNGFAIVTDQSTLERCREEIELYRKTLREEGLSVFVVSDRWKDPYQIRDILRELYTDQRLEGAVFIGDVPIPMIRKAQHLTSAYKKDERQYPYRDCSVPSDRFYEDFDLVFISLPDSTDGLFHYYELDPGSPQYIDCKIYTGRIKPVESYGDKYSQISAYLLKAVAEHKAGNVLDTFVSYTGNGSFSDCLTAWRAERQIVGEQFGDTFRGTQKMKFLRWTMEPYMKDAVIRELRRDDLDLMVFHQHGSEDRMYLSGTPVTLTREEHMEHIKRHMRSLVSRNAHKDDPYRSAREFAREHGLDTTWYAGALEEEMIRLDSLADLRTGIILEEVPDISPNARFVIMDACFNGDFHEEDYIAGNFIFSGGKCAVVFANSVNVLQDKSAFDLMGLLGMGARVGNWAKNINILESHIFGDPTLSFRPAIDPGYDINETINSREPEFWLDRLDDPHPEVRNLAAVRLVNKGYGGDIAPRLLENVKSSPYAIERYNSLMLLQTLADRTYHEALKTAVYDPFEFTRRIAVHRMTKVGSPEFLPYIIDAYVSDRNSARIGFNVSLNLPLFEPGLAGKAIEDYFAGRDYPTARKDREKLHDIVERSESRMARNPLARYQRDIAVITDKEAPLRSRLINIGSLKNMNAHYIVDDLLTVLVDPEEEPELRIRLAEALAWFDLSVERDKISRACLGILEREDPDPEFSKELRRVVSRLNHNREQR